MHICRGSRDLQRQLSGKKMDVHRSSVLSCLDEHWKCIHVYRRKQLRIMTRLGNENLLISLKVFPVEIYQYGNC